MKHTIKTKQFTNLFLSTGIGHDDYDDHPNSTITSRRGGDESDSSDSEIEGFDLSGEQDGDNGWFSARDKFDTNYLRVCLESECIC